MIYDSFARFAKGVGHEAIEMAFPNSGSIALAAGFAAWYGPRYVLSYSQRSGTDLMESQGDAWIPWMGIGRWLGHVAAPLWVPDASDYLAKQVSIPAYFATSLTLNLLARVFFGLKAPENKRDLLPEALRNFGIEIEPQMISFPSNEEERIEFTPQEVESSEILVESKEILDQPKEITAHKNTVDEKDNTIIVIANENSSESALFEENEALIKKGFCRWKICC